MFVDLARDAQFLLDAAHDVNDGLLGLHLDVATNDLAVLDSLHAIEEVLRGAASFTSWGLVRIGELIARVEA